MKIQTKKKNFFDLNHFKILGKEKQKSELTEKETETELSKPLWFEINKKEFEELTGDTYSNQDNNDFKIKINKKTYDLENAKKF